MRTQSRDTSPEAERVQIELLRKATVAQRVSLAFSLTESALKQVQRAIRKAHPNASEEELRLIFVEVHYGKELADRLRAYLGRKKQ
jgi:hypothetical protein